MEWCECRNKVKVQHECRRHRKGAHINKDHKFSYYFEEHSAVILCSFLMLNCKSLDVIVISIESMSRISAGVTIVSRISDTSDNGSEFLAPKVLLKV
jgi:hypothetical protein